MRSTHNITMPARLTFDTSNNGDTTLVELDGTTYYDHPIRLQHCAAVAELIRTHGTQWVRHAGPYVVTR